MTKGPREEKMHLDMPFDEALERFIGVEPAEVAANLEKSKDAKAEADRVLQSAHKPDQTNLTKLRGKGTGSRSQS